MVERETKLGNDGKLGLTELLNKLCITGGYMRGMYDWRGWQVLKEDADIRLTVDMHVVLYFLRGDWVSAHTDVERKI